jgi:sugar lactone lactonase YvrE
MPTSKYCLNLAIFLVSFVILVLNLVVIFALNTSSAAPWDVTLAKKWGTTCLLNSTISCEDPSSPQLQNDSSPQLQTENVGDGKFWGLWGITSDDSAIYAVDVLNHRIQKFDREGLFLNKWGDKGTGNGQFTFPSGIAVDLQYVYVVDHSNRIQIFDKEGQFVNSLGSSGSNPGELNRPEDVDVDSGGRIYVADSGNHRIQVFSPDNTGGLVWGSQGTGKGQFDYPQGISVPAPGHVYVADSHNNRIQYFQLLNDCPQGMTTVTTGVCFVTEWGQSGSSDGQFNRPADVAISDGIVYVVDANNNRIQLFTKEGTFIKKFGSECLVKTGIEPSGECKKPSAAGPLQIGDVGDGQFKYPAGITVRSNTIFVADNFNDRVQAFNVEIGPPPTTQMQANAGQMQANAGQTKTVNAGETVTLDGGNSQPNDGSLQYSWSQVGGDRRVDLQDSNSQQARFEAPSVTEDSTYEFELSVMGTNNQVARDRVSVNVVANQQDQNQNQNPQADAGGNKDVTESNSVQLDGSGSSDNEGDIQSYDWQSNGCDNNQPDGDINNSDNAVATFVAPQIDSTSSVCTVELTVTDSQSATDKDSVEITVNQDPSQGP